MCNSCNTTLASVLNNLFGTPCGCNNAGNGCGCNNNGWNNFTNGFVSGVNAANAAAGNGCGCQNHGCGCNNGFDNYYAQQYALGPYAQNNGCGCCNGF